MTADAALVALLSGEEPLNCVLAEITHAYESGGAPATGTIYLSSTFYATRPIDQPASVSYIDCIAEAPSFSRQIDLQTLTGQGRLSVGQLELDNADGRLAFLLDVVVAGQPCSIYIGNAAWERDRFRRVLYVLVDTVSAPSPDRLVVTLRDPGVLLDARVAGAAIGGSTVNADRRKPLVIGPARNVEGIFGDTTNLRYWLRHAGASLTPNHFAEVRDNGVSLAGGSISGIDTVVIFSAGADTILHDPNPFSNEDVVLVTTTGTVPSPLVAGTQYWVRDRSGVDFKLAATRTGSAIDITASSFTGTITIASRGYFDNGDGSIDLAHTPAGQITADCNVNGSGTDLSDAIADLVLTHAGLHPSLYGGPNTTADSWWNTSDEVQVALVCYEPMNVIELLDQLADAGTCCWGFTADGVLKFARVRPQNSGQVNPNTLTLTEDDVLERDAIEISRLQPLYDQYACVHQQNWTRQSNLAAAVTPANVARYAGPGLVRRGAAPSGTTYSGNPGLYHKTLTDSPEFETLIAAATDGDSQTDADAWLVERKAHFAPHIDLVRVETRLTAYGVDLGDTVTLQLGAAGIGLPASSRDGVLVGIDVDLTGARVTLTVARQRVPDTTTAAHYG